MTSCHSSGVSVRGRSDRFSGDSFLVQDLVSVIVTRGKREQRNSFVVIEFKLLLQVRITSRGFGGL